jgi:prepilin-type N-terminal cleavage/methylation domain-containing protein
MVSPNRFAASLTDGFTLIEMMVAMAMTAILAAVAIPSFVGTIARSRVEGVVNELSIDLQATRTEAIRRRTTATLAVANGGASYSVSYVNPATSATVTLKTVTTPTGVTITASAPIVFSSLRGLADGQTFTVASTSTSAQLRAMTNEIGRVQMCSPNGSFNGYSTC